MTSELGCGGGSSPSCGISFRVHPAIMTAGEVKNWTAVNFALVPINEAFEIRCSSGICIYIQAHAMIAWMRARFEGNDLIKLRRHTNALLGMLSACLAQVKEVADMFASEARTIIDAFQGTSAGTTSGESSNARAFTPEVVEFGRLFFAEIYTSSYLHMCKLSEYGGAQPQHVDPGSLFGATEWPFSGPDRNKKTEQTRQCLATMCVGFSYAQRLLDCFDGEDQRICAMYIANIIIEHFDHCGRSWLAACQQVHRVPYNPPLKVVRNGEGCRNLR